MIVHLALTIAEMGLQQPRPPKFFTYYAGRMKFLLSTHFSTNDQL